MKTSIAVMHVATALLLLGVTLIAGESAAATIVKVFECSISPEELTIQRGEQVVWKAMGVAKPEFEFTPTAEGVRLSITEQGDFAAIFRVPGEYRYHMHIPKGGLSDPCAHGKITVK